MFFLCCCWITCSSLIDKNPFNTCTMMAMLLGLDRERALSGGSSVSLSTLDNMFEHRLIDRISGERGKGGGRREGRAEEVYDT